VNGAAGVQDATVRGGHNDAAASSAAASAWGCGTGADGLAVEQWERVARGPPQQGGHAYSLSHPLTPSLERVGARCVVRAAALELLFLPSFFVQCHTIA
jgi:hypothetical protein